MAASTASKNRKEKRENRNKTIAQEVKRSVAKKLGLTGVSYGPAGQKFASDTVAAKLTGKDQKFYGREASAATNEALVKRGIL